LSAAAARVVQAQLCVYTRLAAILFFADEDVAGTVVGLLSTLFFVAVVFFAAAACSFLADNFSFLVIHSSSLSLSLFFEN
jgi:hypothetical protein